MPSANDSPPAPPREYDFFAAVLSYLVPGLGQIYQGRVGKGVLFMVCLLGLFCYGQYIGSWNNVYLPRLDQKFNSWNLPRPFSDVSNRLPFAGQFWIGVAAWPALLQYYDAWPVAEGGSWHQFQKGPPENHGDVPRWTGPTTNDLISGGDKTWDLGWVYTVIAGVLNILVIYDALAGPAFLPAETDARSRAREETVPA